MVVAGPDTGVSTLTLLEGPVILGASRGPPPEKKNIGRIHGSISRVQMGRGSKVVG